MDDGIPGHSIPQSWGLLVALLVMGGAVLAAPALGLLAFQAATTKGPKWVRTHVRAQVQAVPTARVELTQSAHPDHHWPPTSAVQFALRADSGTQSFREVNR